MHAAALPPGLHRFTAQEVLRQVEAGLLAGAKVELLDGALSGLSPKGPRHAMIGSTLYERLLAARPAGTCVRKEEPIEADPWSLPEPDVALVRGELSHFRNRHPRGAEVELVLEVAVSTLAENRAKLRIYARGGVARAWILDVPGRRLFVYEAPTPEGYRDERVLTDADTVVLPGGDLVGSVASMLD